MCSTNIIVYYVQYIFLLPEQMVGQILSSNRIMDIHDMKLPRIKNVDIYPVFHWIRNVSACQMMLISSDVHFQ